MIISLDQFKKLRKEFKDSGKKVVFTNGCFDILHAGHVDYLKKAKAFGDILVAGLNSDISVRNIKGEKRPIINEIERAEILSGLKSVDYVILFDEDTPENLINEIVPDILIKGADWPIERIVGKDTVIANGGEVKTISFVTNQSTSGIIKTILERYDN
jgi:D-glycero-beta-D-manno-heptose 1-phosphate adenylyltransferase